jgi:multidrug efflux pump subunit AcrA (membrane-fusion protein)
MAMTSPPGTRPQSARPRFYQRTWFVVIVTALAALLVGTVIGLQGADATSDPKYKAQTERLESAESELAFATASLRDARDALADAEGTASEAGDRLASLESQLDDRRAELKKRETALKKTLNALEERKARLKEREESVKAAEALIAETTVPGDGNFEVGVDIERGVYTSPGRQGCSYAVSGDAEGTDVLLTNTTPGPASVSLRDGTWFVTRGCAEWTRQ